MGAPTEGPCLGGFALNDVVQHLTYVDKSHRDEFSLCFMF